MIDIKLFKEKKILEKLKISLFNLPPEKSFYSGSAFFLCGILILVSTLYFLSKLTVLVPSRNQNISIANVGNFKYFLPFYAHSDVDNFVSSLLYSGILKKDINNQYVNDLAENITKDETGTKINIQLKDNLKFSNGEKITTDDVIFTYELASNILVDGINRVKYEGLTFEKIDDNNLIINLSKNFSNVSEILTLGIISKDDYSSENFETLNTSSKSLYSITSGIYKITSTEKDNTNIKKINLTINNNKYSAPYLKYISITTYKTLEDINTDINDDVNVDIILNTNKDITDFTKINHITPKITALFLNGNKKDILAKKKVRESIYHIINRNELVASTEPRNIPTFDLFPASELRSDLDKSTEIENVSASPTNINLTIVDNEKQNKLAESIKESLAKINININIVKENQSEILNNIIKNRDFEILLYSIEVNNPEDLYAFWHSTQRNAPGLNITGYTSTAFDKNLSLIKTSSSSEEIQKSLENMKEEFYIEYPYIPLYTTTESLEKKNTITLETPKQISSKKELSADIINWHKEKEKIWPIINKYQDKLTLIYKLIH